MQKTRILCLLALCFIWSLLPVQASAYERASIDQIKPSRGSFSANLLSHWIEMLQLLGSEKFSMSAKPVIKMPTGYILLGGQHEVLAARTIGWKNIPIEIIKDFSMLSQEEAEAKLEQNGWLRGPLRNWGDVPTVPLLSKSIPKSEEELIELLCRDCRPLPFNANDYADRLNETIYVNNQFFLPGQVTYSSLEVRTKIAEEIQDRTAIWDAEEEEWILPYDRGRSVLPDDRPALGILVIDGIVTVDGNHKIMANKAFGGTRSPVTIYLDLAQYGISSQDLTSEHVYLWRKDGTRAPQLPLTYTAMDDDPNRFFAARITGKVSLSGNKLKDLEILKRKVPDDAIVIKFNRDIDFFELHVARVLHRYGFHFEGNSEADITPEHRQRAQEILLQAQKDGDPIMQSVVVLAPKQNFLFLSDGDLLDLAVERLEKCGTLLRKDDPYF